MGIHHKSFHHSINFSKHHIGGFSPEPREPNRLLHCLWKFPTKFRKNHPRKPLDAFGFVFIKPSGENFRFNRRKRGFRKGLEGRKCKKEFRCDLVHTFVRTLCTEDDSDGKLVWYRKCKGGFYDTELRLQETVDFGDFWCFFGSFQSTNKLKSEI